MSAPEADRQSYHKEGMCSEVGCNGKVTIKSRSSHLLLHPGKIWRLPSDQGQHLLAQVVSPFWQGALICDLKASVERATQEKPVVPRRTVIKTPQTRINDIAAFGRAIRCRGENRCGRRGSGNVYVGVGARQRGIMSRVAHGFAAGGKRQLRRGRNRERRNIEVDRLLEERFSGSTCTVWSFNGQTPCGVVISCIRSCDVVANNGGWR